MFQVFQRQKVFHVDSLLIQSESRSSTVGKVASGVICVRIDVVDSVWHVRGKPRCCPRCIRQYFSYKT
ncbi:hypothetical protein EMIT0357P_30522 [Pseudomonas marginalis]